MKTIVPNVYFDHKAAPDDFKKAFEGYKILEVGMTTHYIPAPYYPGDKPWKSIVEGGLTFILEKDGKKRKVILGYTELGEWIETIEESV